MILVPRLMKFGMEIHNKLNYLEYFFTYDVINFLMTSTFLTIFTEFFELPYSFENDYLHGC